MSEREAVPIRIQRKRTKGWRMPPGTVYVGRPCHADVLLTIANGSAIATG